jgi:hypothetical protein
MATAGIQNYVNTIIFCMVLKIISIIVLGLVLFDFAHPMIIYFLITIEIGIIAVIALALYNITTYEKRMAEESKNLLKSRIDLVVCPDYFSRSENDICVNSYTTGDGRYTYTIENAGPVSLSNYINKPVDNVCTTFTNSAYRNGIYMPDSNIYPWTYLSSKCDVL